MSTSTAPASASNLPSDSRSRPLRRLSQLRSYTQNHLTSSSSSSSSSSSFSSSTPNGQLRSSYRNSISNRVPWRSSGAHQASSAAAAADSESATAHSTHASSCPEPERQSTLARYGSAFFSSHRGLETDLHSQGSSSSRSTPTNESGASQTQGTMARLRGLTQTTDSRGNNNNNNNNNDSNSNSNANTSANNNDNRPDASSSSDSANLQQDGSVEPSDAAENPEQPKQKATMRFFPYQDTHQTARPSLHFIPVSRTLPSDSCVIRVGRYSERDGIPIANPSEPSDAPIGFKSKVVSRKHCELIFLNGQWNIKDVGSSSGTFLNHMRLSQPNMASRLYTVKDGDIVQLGIDFRGGEEMIFRCVRIRIECNRSWQRQPNEFNKNTESLIKNLGKGNTADYSGCRECSICLGSVLVHHPTSTQMQKIEKCANIIKRPYQCLFMAACAHVWHYKCVSRLIHTPDYPIFQCPNCRAYTDLSAEVDDSTDPVEEGPKENALEVTPTNAEQQPRSQTQSPALETNPALNHPPREDNSTTPEPELSGSDLPVEAGLAVNIENMCLHDESRGPSANSSTPAPAPTSNPTNIHHSANIDIPGSQSASPSPGNHLTRPAQSRARSEMSEDNPLTPRNDSGPLAFDGWTGIP